MLKLKILSYNILCDRLSDPSFYTNCDPKHLNQYNRLDKLLQILYQECENSISTKIDTIFCLQEVCLHIQLSALYKLFYQYQYNVLYVGDVLIAYPNRFKLLHCDSGNINKLFKNANIDISPQYKSLIDTKHKFFILINLKCSITNKTFTVINTHLIAIGEIVKLLQLILLFKMVDSYDNVIFAGDFNISSDSDYLNLPLTGIIENKYGKYQLKKKYKSLYDINKGFITTHTSNRITPIYSEMIDYIFLSLNIKIINCKKLNTKRELQNNKDYYPNKNESSDHVLIWGLIEI
jgi:mRNA deadenylase 3'-5' endonuclease subunit Ccr4